MKILFPHMGNQNVSDSREKELVITQLGSHELQALGAYGKQFLVVFFSVNNEYSYTKPVFAVELFFLWSITYWTSRTRGKRL